MNTIMTLMNQVSEGAVVLPAIQRDFVWGEERIAMLLDSIMRGYPTGIILLWETTEDIQFRQFEKDYQPDNILTFHENPGRKRLRLVLDGQQRLQSLYVALYGTYAGRELAFDVLSGDVDDDFSGDRYRFRFISPSPSQADGQTEKAKAYYVPVADIFRMSPLARQSRAREIAEELHLVGESAQRIELNLSILDSALTKDVNVLHVSTIDENLPATSPDRKSEADVLEIFVRINRLGTALSRSDLIFSMLKLKWRESAEALPEFVRKINQGNSLDLDTDFVIRCLFVVSDLGAKYDLDVLRKRSAVKALQENFKNCCDAIAATVDFVLNSCWCSSSSLIGGTNTLVPFVYLLFHRSKHEVSNSELEELRKVFFLLAFAKPLSRYGDIRITGFVREELKALAGTGATIPLSKAVYWVKSWQRVPTFEDLLQANPALTLHLVQGLSGAKVQYHKNSPEIDHIFSRSELRKKGRDADSINNLANYWILAQGKNRNKSDQHPADYFADVPPSELRRALIDPDLLNYGRYGTFLRTRMEAITSRVKKKLDWTSEDYPPTVATFDQL
jgi:hypothetical protein